MVIQHDGPPGVPIRNSCFMRRVKFWVEVIVSLPLLVSLAVWLLAPAYVKLTGVEVKGEVISKHEEIEMTGEDRWRHAFRIRYRYRPVDTPHWLIGEDHVTAAIYRRLQIGSPVAVRYNGVSMLRPLVSVPYIAEPTPLARISFNGK